MSSSQRLALEEDVKSQNNADAASRLAQHYLLVEEDYKLARYWFKKAALLGNEHDKEVYKSFEESLKDD